MERITPVEATQVWLEEHIIGRTICPPLRRAAKPYRQQDGKIDWSQFSRVLQIEDLTSLDPQSPRTIDHVTSRYLEHLNQIDNNSAPLSRILVFADFSTNSDFASFAERIKNQAHHGLLTEKGAMLAASLFVKSCEAQGVAMSKMVKAMNTTTSVLADDIVFGPFAPIPFFGRRLSERDILGQGQGRGPDERSMYLQRAPYYSFQFINAIEGFKQMSDQSPKVHANNNRLIDTLNLEEFEAFIEGLRSREAA